ncbi:hypothetical protein AB6A23_16735 [Paenibacillus tarimensis]
MSTITRTWSTDLTFYALSDQFSLRKANAKEWSIITVFIIIKRITDFLKSMPLMYMTAMELIGASSREMPAMKSKERRHFSRTRVVKLPSPYYSFVEH